jgi:menaquinone-dependent protoporphyrinogen IX oxidase
VPRVLLVYYSYTQQSRRVADVLAEVFRERGFEVHLAAIEFTDARYAARFARLPLRHAYVDVFRMLVPQLRRATGEIRVPDTVLQGQYDLVCIGSPTWWLTTNMPIRSFLKSDAAGGLLAGSRFAAYVVCRRYWRNNLSTVKKLGVKRGGDWLEGMHFAFAGGQIRSFLALVSYLASGEIRERYLKVRIPPTNLKLGYEDAARRFAGRLADRHDAEERTRADARPTALGRASG